MILTATGRLKQIISQKLVSAGTNTKAMHDFLKFLDGTS